MKSKKRFFLFCLFMSALGANAASDPDQYTLYTDSVLAKLFPGKDLSATTVVTTPEHFPEVVRVHRDGKREIQVSRGVFTFSESEDELAFLLLRALSTPDPFDASTRAKRLAEETAIRKLVEHPSYNPAAALSYFERTTKLLESLKASQTRQYHSSSDRTYRSEEMMIAKEHAKIFIGDAAWSKVDLSTRLEQFTPFFPEGSVAKRGLNHLAALHHFYGPDYRWYIESCSMSAVAARIAAATLSTAGALYGLFKIRAFNSALSLAAAPFVGNRGIFRNVPSIYGNILVNAALVGEVAFIAAFVRHVFFVPPASVEGPVAILNDLHTKLDTLKGSKISESDFVRIFGEISNLQSDPYWLDGGIKKAFAKLLDSGIASGLRLAKTSTLNLDRIHFNKLSEDFLSRLGTLLGFDSFSKWDRLAVYPLAEKGRVVPFVVARLYLANANVHSGPEVVKAVSAISKTASFADFPEGSQVLESAAKNCHLFFQQGEESHFDYLMKAMKDLNSNEALHRTQVCLLRAMKRTNSYPIAVQQRNLLKTFFYETPSVVAEANHQLAQFAWSFDDIKDLAVALKDFYGPAFNAYQVGSANGEALLTRPSLIRDLDGVRAVLTCPYFWSKEDTHYKGLENRNAREAMVGPSNGYNIELTESLHGLLLKKVKEFGPDLSAHDLYTLWLGFVERGTSVHSDALFKLAQAKNTDPKHEMMDPTRPLGKLHDLHMMRNLVETQVAKMLSSVSPERMNKTQRIALIIELAALSFRALGVSLAHREVMEGLSRAIESSPEESDYIEKLKKGPDEDKDSRASTDLHVNLLDSIIQETRNWTKKRQWDFLLYLVGHQRFLEPESAASLHHFAMTPLLLRAKFTALPHAHQARAVDAILAQSGGLLEDMSASNPWRQKVSEYFVAMVGEDGRQVVRELFKAYFEALNTGGFKYYKSTLFAQLLVSSDGGKTTDIIAKVCKHFGAFGIKLGQFLLATGVLPKEENDALRNLEDEAREPTRYEVFQDLREISGTSEVEHKIGPVAGGGSLKYVVMATKPDGQSVVLKVLAKDAIYHTQMEEKILKRMADYLVAEYGDKYRVLKIAVFAAAEAVKRELSFEDEVANSQLAYDKMYKACEQEGVVVKQVKETFSHKRLIEAEYAPGTSLHSAAPEHQSKLASAILRCEMENLFPSSASGNATVFFDPDRHLGNYRVTGDRVTPIDFGQLHAMSIEERDQIIELAAVAGILRTIGENGFRVLKVMTPPLANKIVQTLQVKVDDAVQKRFVRQLATSFAQGSPGSALTSYYQLLSILKEEGLLDALGKKQIPFYDLPKGLLQLSRLAEYLAQDNNVETVEGHFKEVVKQRAHQIVKELGLEEPSISDLLWSHLDY